MSVYSQIIAALKARLETVPSIGVTHGYQRFNADWSRYLDQFRTTIGGKAQIRGWMVMLDDASPIVDEDSRQGGISRTYNCLVVGFLGVEDAENSEKTFWDLVEAVMDALDGRATLGVSGVVVGAVGPARARVNQHRQLGSVMCHYTEIAVPVVVDKDIAYT